MRCLSSSAILALAFASACSTSHDPPPLADAGPRADATVVDPGSDAGTSVDAFVEIDGGSEIDGGPEDGGPGCAPDGHTPTRFRDLFDAVIARHACTDCHAAGRPLPAGSLDLGTAESAYRTLVNVRGCDGVRMRVTPCRPEESTLSVVPTGREEPCGGMRHTFGDGIVTAGEASMIDEWIATGAAW
jgi:hypothetical protein